MSLSGGRLSAVLAERPSRTVFVASSRDSTLVAFQANIEKYINSILDKGLEAVRKETADAMDTYQAKTDSALASLTHKLTQQQQQQQQRQAASDLQSRVDPINWTYDTIRA